MDKNYFQSLIEEAKSRGGGLIVNQDDKPAAVVMTVEKYNELLVKAGVQDKAGASTQNELEEDFHSNNNKKILVTGGAGYIGSHVVRELLKSGYEVIVIDNLSTGKRQHVPQEAKFIEGDISDTNLLRDIFASENIYAVMHFAASLEVEESVREPQKYLQNNALNTANLLSAMVDSNVKKFIFSSTAAVYGNQEVTPIQETAKVQPNNPYGYSKLLAERIIKYYCHFMDFHAVIFRFFNACGADFDGSIKPTHESHLLPIVIETAMGKRSSLKVYGSDYDTPDGTCVRDYVHVLDIARAHVLVLDKMEQMDNYRIYNIGTGTGSSVLEVIDQASKILNKPIPTEVAPRRAGDSVVTVADNARIKQDLGFELEYSDLPTIIKTTWHQMNHL